MKKIEQSFEKTPILHVIFGLRKFETIDKNAFLVYFVRKSLLPTSKLSSLSQLLAFDKFQFIVSDPIDNFDEMSDMSEQFIVGTMRGSFIHKLSSLSESIMRQILNLQMRVPKIHEKNVIETKIEAGESDDKVIDFSRPSDYRMKAIEAKHSGVSISGDDASHRSGTSRMSTVGTATSTESIKTGTTPYEGIMLMNCFMRKLFKFHLNSNNKYLQIN